jgi:hypothetical protein
MSEAAAAWRRRSRACSARRCPPPRSPPPRPPMAGLGLRLFSPRTKSRWLELLAGMGAAARRPSRDVVAARLGGFLSASNCRELGAAARRQGLLAAAAVPEAGGGGWVAATPQVPRRWAARRRRGGRPPPPQPRGRRQRRSRGRTDATAAMNCWRGAWAGGRWRRTYAPAAERSPPPAPPPPAPDSRGGAAADSPRGPARRRAAAGRRRAADCEARAAQAAVCRPLSLMPHSHVLCAGEHCRLCCCRRCRRLSLFPDKAQGRNAVRVPIPCQLKS